MGIFNLFGFCIALLFAPALAFANDVRVGVSPTTGYYEVTSKTFNVPKGASVSSSTAVSPTVTPLAGGGFQQSMGGGITIEGLKKPAPFTARAAAGLQTMKNGAKKLSRSNPARFAAAVGLGALLDSVDWIIKNGQVVKKTSDIESFEMTEAEARSNFQGSYFSSSSAYYTGQAQNSSSFAFLGMGTDGWGGYNHYYYCSTGSHQGSNLAGVSRVYLTGKHSDMLSSETRCFYSNAAPKFTDFPKVEIPVSNSDLDDLIDRSYVPLSSDFVLLTPYFPPDFILVDPIPAVITDLGITNTFDSSGWLTGTEQKTSTTEFTVSNNSTSQPSISSSTSVKTETFKDGQSQGSTVTNTTQPAVGGGGGGKAPTVEIPTDCDFHPTLCAWMNWTKEPLEEPDHDLKQIMHTVDFEEKKTISFGSKTCPAPYDIHLGLIDRTYQLSFQPACDFAGYLYFFVMAAAYIFAAYISVGVVRNG